MVSQILNDTDVRPGHVRCRCWNCFHHWEQIAIRTSRSMVTCPKCRYRQIETAAEIRYYHFLNRQEETDGQG